MSTYSVCSWPYVVWYTGLALGGIVRIGQLQLLQPFLTIFAAALLLHEQVSWKEVPAAAVVVIGCGLVGRKAGVQQTVARSVVPHNSAIFAA